MDPFDPAPAADAPLWQRWLSRPILVLLLAVVSLSAGIWMASNTTREAAERAALPPRADCLRFPGACDQGVPTSPPPELQALAGAVDAADVAWRTTLERERRSGVFPDKGLTAMREALATTDAAVRDARALLQEAEAQGDGERARAGDRIAAGGLRGQACAARTRGAPARGGDMSIRMVLHMVLHMGIRMRVPVRALAALLPALLLAPKAARAQTPVDMGASAPRGSVVQVRLQSGSVRLTGWDRDSVHVSGLLAPGESWVNRLVNDTVRMRAEGMPRGLAAPSELEIFVPRTSTLVVRAAAASLVVRDVDRDVDVATAAGNLLVEAVGGGVRAETMQGTLTIIGPNPRVQASTASGVMLVSVPYDTINGVVHQRRAVGAVAPPQAPFGTVVLRSVSGSITFDAPQVDSALVQNVRGDTRVNAEPSAGGSLRVESHVGLVTLGWRRETVPVVSLEARTQRGGLRGRLPAAGGASTSGSSTASATATATATATADGEDVTGLVQREGSGAGLVLRLGGAVARGAAISSTPAAPGTLLIRSARGDIVFTRVTVPPAP